VGGAAALAATLGLPIGNIELLDEALTHSSWLHEHPGHPGGHNERLELLGDAVVDLAIAAALYARYPADDEGLLSARRAAIVSTAGLAQLADRIGLGDHLLLGEGEARGGGRTRPSVLAGAFEAVAGAIYLDLGWEAARGRLVGLAMPEIERDEGLGALKSPKSRLQELTQRSARERPVYAIVEASGPDHLRRYVVEVRIEGEVRGVGEGPSRRAAETAAARQAVEALDGSTRLRPRRRRRVAKAPSVVATADPGPEPGT
jgi:ribonuclease-3